jgi:hypothetical protein
MTRKLASQNIYWNPRMVEAEENRQKQVTKEFNRSSVLLSLSAVVHNAEDKFDGFARAIHNQIYSIKPCQNWLHDFQTSNHYNIYPCDLVHSLIGSTFRLSPTTTAVAQRRAIQSSCRNNPSGRGNTQTCLPWLRYVHLTVTSHS